MGPFLTLLATVPLVAGQGTLIRPRQQPGMVAKYVVAVKETDYAGAGTSKVTATTATQTPVQIEVTGVHAGGADLRVTSGPLVVLNRSVGRAKVRQFSVDAGGSLRGASPALLTIPFPPSGVQRGQSWTAGLFGPAPLPSGLVATYRLETIAGPYARVSMRTDVKAAGHVTGSGDLFLDGRTGYLHHGEVHFDIAYVRPDPQNRTKMNVDSHVRLDCRITPG